MRTDSNSCPRCGGTMLGDGFGCVRHCENARDEDYWHAEPDGQPVLCQIRAERELSQDEISVINSQRVCPWCRLGKFLEGPHGGSCINMRCEHCGAEFNLTIFIKAVLMGQTLNRDAPELYPKRMDFDATGTMTPVRLAKLSVCPCGFPALDEGIKLGTEYFIEESAKTLFEWTCGGCKKESRHICVYVHTRAQSGGGFLPAELFEEI